MINFINGKYEKMIEQERLSKRIWTLESNWNQVEKIL